MDLASGGTQLRTRFSQCEVIKTTKKREGQESLKVMTIGCKENARKNARKNTAYNISFGHIK